MTAASLCRTIAPALVALASVVVLALSPRALACDPPQRVAAPMVRAHGDVPLDRIILGHLDNLEVRSAFQAVKQDGPRLSLQLEPAALADIQKFLLAIEKKTPGVYVHQLSLSPDRKTSKNRPWKCHLEFRTGAHAVSTRTTPAFSIVATLELIVQQFPGARIESLHVKIGAAQKGQSQVQFQVADFAESVELTERLRGQLPGFSLGSSFSRKGDRGDLNIELRPVVAQSAASPRTEKL